MEEVWKNIVGFENLYQVSNFGNIKNIKTNHILKGCVGYAGYKKVTLIKNEKRYSKSIHRLVAEHFIDNPVCKPQVNHIDGNKLNNNANNLEWVTAYENIQHAVDNNLLQKKKKIKEEIRINKKKMVRFSTYLPYYIAIPFQKFLNEKKGIRFDEWLEKEAGKIAIKYLK